VFLTLSYIDVFYCSFLDHFFLSSILVLYCYRIFFWFFFSKFVFLNDPIDFGLYLFVLIHLVFLLPNRDRIQIYTDYVSDKFVFDFDLLVFVLVFDFDLDLRDFSHPIGHLLRRFIYSYKYFFYSKNFMTNDSRFTNDWLTIYLWFTNDWLTIYLWLLLIYYWLTNDLLMIY
jgi:hypothetical protein